MPLFAVQLERTEYLTWLVEAPTEMDAEDLMRFRLGTRPNVRLLEILEDDVETVLRADAVDSREEAYDIYVPPAKRKK